MAATLRSTVSLKSTFAGAKVEKATAVKAAPVRASKSSVVVCKSPAQKVVEAVSEKVQGAAKATAAVAACALMAGQADALTYNEIQNLTYMQVKGTGIANTCPVIDGEASELTLGSGSYVLDKFCMEPTSFKVKEDDEFVGTKLMTRLTYTLDAMSGQFVIGEDGGVTFTEEDGIDYAATTVQLPGGERVPFLFTVKELVAQGNTSQFGGDFTVPSYRGSSFLDPKGRGGSTGYDNAVALPAADNDALEGENNKSTVALKGSAVFNVAKYDDVTGEVAGVFESIQPSDTDLGAKVPKDIKITGIWYGQLS